MYKSLGTHKLKISSPIWLIRRFRIISINLIHIYIYNKYLLHSGYDSEMVDKQFVKVAKMKRKETLKTRTKPKLNRRKYNFVTTWDPAFPDIRKALHKFTKVLWKMKNVGRYSPKDHSG